MSDPTSTTGGSNPYETLGVAPGTPQQLLAPAYQQRRAQFEAARAGGTDPSVVDGWVAELDAAWAVLADPEARARFDQAAGFPPPAGPYAPPGAPVGFPPTQPPTQRSGSGRAGAVIGGLVALALTVGIGVWASRRDQTQEDNLRDDSGTLVEDTTLPASQLRVGDCFQEEREGPPSTEATAVQEVTAVVCTEPHDNEIIASAFLTGESYPSETAINDQVRAACLPAFREFVGVAYARSELEIGYIYPDRISFLQGSRYLQCYVVDPSGPVTGSLEGSNR